MQIANTPYMLYFLTVTKSHSVIVILHQRLQFIFIQIQNKHTQFTPSQKIETELIRIEAKTLMKSKLIGD